MFGPPHICAASLGLGVRASEVWGFVIFSSFGACRLGLRFLRACWRGRLAGYLLPRLSGRVPYRPGADPNKLAEYRLPKLPPLMHCRQHDVVSRSNNDKLDLCR